MLLPAARSGVLLGKPPSKQCQASTARYIPHVYRSSDRPCGLYRDCEYSPLPLSVKNNISEEWNPASPARIVGHITWNGALTAAVATDAGACGRLSRLRRLSWAHLFGETGLRADPRRHRPAAAGLMDGPAAGRDECLVCFQRGKDIQIATAQNTCGPLCGYTVERLREKSLWMNATSPQHKLRGEQLRRHANRLKWAHALTDDRPHTLFYGGNIHVLVRAVACVADVAYAHDGVLVGQRALPSMPRAGNCKLCTRAPPAEAKGRKGCSVTADPPLRNRAEWGLGRERAGAVVEVPRQSNAVADSQHAARGPVSPAQVGVLPIRKVDHESICASLGTCPSRSVAQLSTLAEDRLFGGDVERHVLLQSARAVLWRHGPLRAPELRSTMIFACPGLACAPERFHHRATLPPCRLPR